MSNRACRGFQRLFGFPCWLLAATLACRATDLPSFLLIHANDGFRRCRVRLRAFRTGSALPLLKDRVPVLGAFGPEAPDPYVALRKGVRGPITGVVGIAAAVDSHEAEGLQPLRDGGADARGGDDQGVSGTWRRPRQHGERVDRAFDEQGRGRLAVPGRQPKRAPCLAPEMLRATLLSEQGWSKQRSGRPCRASPEPKRGRWRTRSRRRGPTWWRRGLASRIDAICAVNNRLDSLAGRSTPRPSSSLRTVATRLQEIVGGKH